MTPDPPIEIISGNGYAAGQQNNGFNDGKKIDDNGLNP